MPTQKAYNLARARYLLQGHDWQLTLEQWQALWAQGDYANRGNRVGQYSIKRKHSDGPWSASNCYLHRREPSRTKSGRPRKRKADHSEPSVPQLGTKNGVRTLTVRQWAEEVRDAQGQPLHTA